MQSLPQALSQFLKLKYKITVPAASWPLDKLPIHLKVRYRVIDDQGREIQQSRNISELHQDLSDTLQTTVLDTYRQEWEKNHVTKWDFGLLPQSIELKGKHGLVGYAYPALCLKNESICLRLFLNEQEAMENHLKGVVSLYALFFAEKLNKLRKNIAFSPEKKNMALNLGNPKQIEQSILNRIQKDLFSRPIRNEDDFLKHAHATAPEIFPYGQQVLINILPVILGFADTWNILQKLKQKNKFNSPVMKFLEATQSEFHKLVPVDFPELYSDERLREIPRYIKAIGLKAERGSLNPGAAQIRLQEVFGYSEKLQAIQNSVTNTTSREKRQKIEELFWMIEEYKVSLFAQELKTPFPVSPKRLNQLFSEIAEIVI